MRYEKNVTFFNFVKMAVCEGHIFMPGLWAMAPRDKWCTIIRGHLIYLQSIFKTLLHISHQNKTMWIRKRWRHLLQNVTTNYGIQESNQLWRLCSENTAFNSASDTTNTIQRATHQRTSQIKEPVNKTYSYSKAYNQLIFYTYWQMI